MVDRGPRPSQATIPGPTTTPPPAPSGQRALTGLITQLNAAERS